MAPIVTILKIEGACGGALAWVSTSRTPGARSAAATSMATMRPRAISAGTIQPTSGRGPSYSAGWYS